MFFLNVTKKLLNMLNDTIQVNVYLLLCWNQKVFIKYLCK